MNSEDFIKWTKALIHHFFLRGSEEEVFLYVDEQILDQIGKKNELGDHNSFLNTFLFPVQERIRLFDELFLHERGYYPQRSTNDNQRINSRSILNFAIFLEEKFVDTPYYFPYTLLVMYYASQARNENERTLRYYIQNALEINDYSPIEKLFSRLHDDFPEFKDKLKTSERIAGKIKYQLLLSPAEIRDINEALFRISFEDDDSLTYVDKILKIKDYVNDPVKTILKESFSNSDYQYRINNIFETFDLEIYKRAHQKRASVITTECFALYLDFSEGRGFRLLSSYRPSGKTEIQQDDNHFTFTPSIDSIDSYNNEFVEYNGSGFVELNEYSLRTHDLEIRPIALGDVVFFYKQKEGGYVQSRNSYNKKVYIFVKKDRRGQKIEQWENWATQNATNCRRIDESYDVRDLTKERWALYLADGLASSYYTREREWNLINSVRSIRKKSGIKCGKNVYLVNALPFFEFPDAICEQGLNVIIEMEGGQLSHNVDYRLFIQANKLIIDLIKDIDYEGSKLIEVSINYTNPVTSEQLTLDTPDGKLKFYVRGQNIVYNQNDLYSFNNWGEKTDETERIIQGNIISGITHKYLGKASHQIETNDSFRDYADPFYFINLLASCIYKEPNGRITRERLKECIRYTTTRLNIQAEENGFTTKVISLLVNSGYIAADYSTSHYQAIPPAFTKIPRSFHAGSTSQVWMLTGAYTRKFKKDLDDFCTKNADGRERNVPINIEYRYSKKLDNSRGSLKLLPPIILVGSNFDPEEFKQRFSHGFDIIKQYDQALDLLSLVSPISEYDKTMETIPRERVDVSMFVRPKSKEFPRIREDNPYEYNNHIYIEKSEKGDFLKPSISEKWNDLFCYYKRNKPFVIIGTQHIYLPEDLRLPSLIQRSLFIMNVGIPKYQKVFLCDIPTTLLYTSMKSYKINDDRLNTFLERITGKKNEADNPFIKEKVKSSKYIRDGEWKYSLNLWGRKEDEDLNNTIPNMLMVLTYSYRLINIIESYDVAVSVYSNKDGISNYVRKHGAFHEIKLDHVTMFSSIIKSGRNCFIPFTEHSSLFTLPNKDLYNIEKITIL